jgi:hypothetical protein
MQPAEVEFSSVKVLEVKSPHIMFRDVEPAEVNFIEGRPVIVTVFH